jgi:hypothetical protein
VNPPEEPQLRTRIFARVLGPFFVIVPVADLVRGTDMQQLVSDFGANVLWPWVTGAFLLLSGLVIIALHQYWRGAAAVIVSVLGWVLALRGLFLLAFPQTFMSAVKYALNAGGLWEAVYVCLAVMGLYLAYAGWRPAATPESTARQNI